MLSSKLRKSFYKDPPEGYRNKTRGFIEKAQKVHGNKYNYSRLIYIDFQIEITIICSNHGAFLITPLNHLNGQGCVRCRLGNMGKL